MLESAADRLGYVQTFGEPFSTGRPEKLLLIFDRESIDQAVGEFVVEGDEPLGLARSADVSAHALAKGRMLTRDADGQQYEVKRLKPDGQGMTLVVFKE